MLASLNEYAPIFIMPSIPASTLKEILALRSENGLEATEEALQADLTKSKAKWTLEETPRYRRAGRSPLYVSGKYLTAFGTCPATGEADGKEKKAKASSAVAGRNSTSSSKIDETAFYKVLHGKGFGVKISQNLLTGELETHVPAAISKLGLKFSAAPANATDVHVSQTSPQVQITLTLDKFLELAGIKP